MSKNKPFTTVPPKEVDVIVQETTQPPVNDSESGATPAIDKQDESGFQPSQSEPVVTTKAPEAPKEVAPTAKAIDEDGVDISVLANRVAWIREHGTIAENTVISILENYVSICGKSVDLNKIGVEQQRLWRMFEYIHSQPKEFSKLYSLVLMYAKEHQDTIFDLTKLFRANEALTLSQDQLQCFNNLRTLIINTVKTPDVRRVNSLLDVSKVVNHSSIPEHVRGLYISFYS